MQQSVHGNTGSRFILQLATRDRVEHPRGYAEADTIHLDHHAVPGPMKAPEHLDLAAVERMVAIADRRHRRSVCIAQMLCATASPPMSYCPKCLPFSGVK